MTSNQYRILIAIDSHRREFLGCEFLKKALEAKGFEAELCSRYTLGHSFDRFKPHVVFVHSPHKIPELERIKNYSIVVLLPAKSFVGCIDGIIKMSSPEFLKGSHFDAIDIRYCWGETDYSILKSQKLFPKAELVLTGHPILDTWYRRNAKGRSENKKLTIGITPTLRAMTHIVGAVQNPVKLVLDVEQNGHTGFFDPPNHAEAYIAFEAAWIRIIGDIVKELKDFHVYVRPHPIEREEYYKYFERYPHVTVSNKKNIISWLDEVDVVLSYISSSQLDAYVRGVNVISIKNLFPNYIIERLPKMLELEHDKYFFAPHSIAELKENLTEKKYDQEKLDHFMKRINNYPAPIRPSVAIAEHLHNYVSRFDWSKKKPFQKITDSRFKFVPEFFRKDDLFLMYRDFRGSLFNRENVSLSYCRHRLYRNYKDRSLARQFMQEFTH